MTELTQRSRRRWFKLRLSTWFVLMGILTWAMTCWPWIVTRPQWELCPPNKPSPVGFDRSTYPGRWIWLATREPAYVWIDWRKQQAFVLVDTPTANFRLLYPALALAAFAGSKVGWLIVERQDHALYPLKPEG